MINWKNLNELASFQELAKAEKVCLPEVMAGENGAERARTYSVPMAEGLSYNYAAKSVDGTILEGLKKLAEECAETLLPTADKQGIALRVDGEETLIHGDKTILWELCYNLMDNAIRYNRVHGSVNVILHKNTLTVNDTGIGIPPEHQDRIFERFYRVDKSHSRQTGGTGLGLSIVKHAAEHHNAKLTLSSTPGVGTVISVEFPHT